VSPIPTPTLPSFTSPVPTRLLLQAASSDLAHIPFDGSDPSVSAYLVGLEPTGSESSLRVHQRGGCGELQATFVSIGHRVLLLDTGLTSRYSIRCFLSHQTPAIATLGQRTTPESTTSGSARNTSPFTSLTTEEAGEEDGVQPEIKLGGGHRQ
jgi:hypothetical protein